MARVIRFHVLEESHSGDNVFYIHRPYILSNPYTHIKNKETKALVKVKDRETAIELYSKYFDRMLEENAIFKAEFEKLYEVYKNNDVLYLGCYCHSNETCHGDIIAKKLRQKAMKDAIKNYCSNKAVSDKQL